jgi:hypothetical protein
MRRGRVVAQAEQGNEAEGRGVPKNEVEPICFYFE